MQKITLLVTIMVTISVLISPIAAVSEPENGQPVKEPIKIGALLHLTGDLAMQGAAFREGIELAASSINESGGVNGAPLIIVVEDTEGKPAMAYKGAKKLLEVDGVHAGLVATSAETKSAGTLFESKKVPLICLWDSAPEIERIGQHVFGIGTWTPSSGAAVAEYAFGKLNTRRAAIINNIDEWALSVSEAFAERFTAIGGTVVFNESVNPDNPDFRSIIARMIASQPDMLYAPIGFNTVVFFKQLYQLGFRKPIFESDNLNDEIIAAAGAAVEGVYQTQSVNPDGDNYQAFAQKYKAKFGHLPSLPIYSAWGYDAVHLVAQAATKVGPTPELISRSLYKVQDYQGTSGKISISSEGSSRVMVGLYRVTKGKLELVDH